MTVDEAVTAIDDCEAQIKEIPASPGLRIIDGNSLVMQDFRFRLEAAGFRRFCEQVSAPPVYMSALPSQVRQPVLQHHLDCCDINADRLTVIARNDQFLAFGRPELMRLAGRDVLEAVQTGANCELCVHDFQIVNDSLRADLLVESAVDEPAPGDVVRAGLSVQHSLIGDHATQVESFVFRLVCSNGMTHRDCVDRRAARTRRQPADRRNARALQIAQLRRISAATVGKLREKLYAIRGLRREQVDVDHVMTRFLDRGGMSSRQWLPVLREAWEAEGSERTAFGVMNAFTRVATHRPELSPRHRRILGGLAGILAFRQQHMCPRCFSLLRGSSVENN